MAEYMDREKTKRELSEWCISLNSPHLLSRDDTMFLLDKIPAADVAPVVHGSWVKNNDSFQTDDYYCCYFDYSCSECGEIVNDRYKLPNYCPNCGARMDGGDNDDA